MHWMATNGNIGILYFQLLIEMGVEVDTSDNIGRTPLHWTIINGHFNTVHELLDEGADSRIEDIYSLSLSDLWYSTIDTNF